MMQAPRGVLSSGMLAVTRVLVLKRTCLTGCLQQRQGTRPFTHHSLKAFALVLALLGGSEEGTRGKTPPVVHLPQLRSHSQLPHAHQALATAAHDLPVVRLHRRDAQVVGVERGHGGGGSQVEDPHPETQQRETASLFYGHETYQSFVEKSMINQQGLGDFSVSQTFSKHSSCDSDKRRLIVRTIISVPPIPPPTPPRLWSVLIRLPAKQRQRIPRIHQRLKTLSKASFISRQRNL